jgi:hypothetical protein
MAWRKHAGRALSQLAAVALVSLAPGHASAQTGDAPQDDDGFFLEVAPPESTITRDDLLFLLLPDGIPDSAALYSVIHDAALQDTSKGPIEVCFVGGDLDDRAEIAHLAQVWELPGSSVKFDFGASADTPALCPANSTADVRVGFGPGGTWSLVGLDGLLNRGMTMNFDMGAIKKLDLPRVVAHEFGHALGLYHEHQNPNAKCDEQIDWDRAKAVLTGPDYGLAPQLIDTNFRKLVAQNTPGPYDEKSIMLYPLPRAIFRQNLFDGGAWPSCYHSKNTAISNGDRAVILEYYPDDPAAVRRMRRLAFEKYRQSIEKSGLAAADLSNAKAAASVFFLWNDASEAQPYVEWTRSAVEFSRASAARSSRSGTAR